MSASLARFFQLSASKTFPRETLAALGVKNIPSRDPFSSRRQKHSLARPSQISASKAFPRETLAALGVETNTQLPAPSTANVRAISSKVDLVWI